MSSISVPFTLPFLLAYGTINTSSAPGGPFTAITTARGLTNVTRAAAGQYVINLSATFAAIGAVNLTVFGNENLKCDVFGFTTGAGTSSFSTNFFNAANGSADPSNGFSFIVVGT